MLTNLRAALRTIADEIERCNFASATEKLRAILDSPPTVAELLPLVDAGHEVRWVGEDGDDACATTEGETDSDADILYFRRAPGWTGADHEDWSMSKMRRTDLTQPARLVEVG